VLRQLAALKGNTSVSEEEGLIIFIFLFDMLNGPHFRTITLTFLQAITTPSFYQLLKILRSLFGQLGSEVIGVNGCHWGERCDATMCCFKENFRQ
jgi:hypothetical protein